MKADKFCIFGLQMICDRSGEKWKNLLEVTIASIQKSSRADNCCSVVNIGKTIRHRILSFVLVLVLHKPCYVVQFARERSKYLKGTLNIGAVILLHRPFLFKGIFIQKH